MGKFKMVGTCITRAKESGRMQCSGVVCNILQWPAVIFFSFLFMLFFSGPRENVFLFNPFTIIIFSIIALIK